MATPDIHTHLFLVGSDLVPNITPALHHGFCSGEIFLMAVRKDPHAERLKRILEARGSVPVRFWEIDFPWDISHIRQRTRDFLVAHGHKGAALNASGGTKPMALAAFEVFRQANKPVYHVHPAVDYVVWLHPEHHESFNLQDRLTLEDFFTAHDLHIVSSRATDIPPGLSELSATLLSRAGSLADALGMVNSYAARSKVGLTSPAVSINHLRYTKFTELLNLLEGRNLLWKVEHEGVTRLVFPDEACRFYVNGGWLEEHVYHQVADLKGRNPTIQGVARSVVFQWDERQSKVENELDVVMLADNRLTVIECKTMQFEGDGVKDAEVLYKLAALRNYLGADRTRAVLISFRELPEKAKARAEEFGIKVCDWKYLKTMDEMI
jgi:hypothetical protein